MYCILIYLSFTLEYCIGFAIHQHESPWVYTCSPSWTPLPPPSPYHPSGSSQCTSPEHPVSCIESGLAIHFLYDIIHVSMPFSQIIPPSPSPAESKRLFYPSVFLLLSRIQGLHFRFVSASLADCGRRTLRWLSRTPPSLTHVLCNAFLLSVSWT